ncbi:MAG: hypothetical protein ACJAT2_003775 [Bacteriovoracaceae bacterium]|jgi:hypothetical protein
MKLLLILTLLLPTLAFPTADLSKGIICTKETYNCPSYTGKYQGKRLKNCKAVLRVWKKCKRDVHGLDSDNDGWPCEKNCSKDLFQKVKK